MKRIKLVSLTLIFITFLNISPVFGVDEEAFEVKLSTESNLSPLYLLPSSDEESNLEKEYIHELEKIFVFDFNHNGSTIISKNTKTLDLLGKGDSKQLGPISSWRDRHIFYVVKPQFHNRTVSASVLDVSKQTLTSSDSFPLSGDLAKDRRQIHRLVDGINKNLFGIDGIASKHILYTVKTQNSADSRQWTSEVWEADYDGANARQITAEKSFIVTPVYLPAKPGYASGGFLYVSYQLGQPKIFIHSTKDGKRRRLTYMRGNQLMPAITPQRDKVAFISDITGNPDLFVQPFSLEKGAIGKPQQVFSARQATQGSPTFSPDGKKLAFVSDKDGAPKVYVIQIPEPGASLKEIKPVLISKSNRENSAPSWSPDGTKLAYCSRTKGDRQIWIYDFNTKTEKQVTQGPGHKENPSWAPNSLHLVFNTSDPQASQLYITNLNQMDSVQITFGSQEKRFPNWEP